MHLRLNHFFLKTLLRISKRRIITNKFIKVIKLPPCAACLFGKSHKSPGRTKGKISCGMIRKPSETRPGSMK